MSVGCVGFLNRASQVRILPGAQHKHAGQEHLSQQSDLDLGPSWGYTWCELERCREPDQVVNEPTTTEYDSIGLRAVAVAFSGSCSQKLDPYASA